MKSGLRYYLIFVLLFLLAACVPGGRADLNPQAAFETMVAATVRALPTPTLALTSTATTRPTSIRVAPTDWPTETPFPTFTPMPTMTPFPTYTVVKTYGPTAKVKPGNKQGNYYFGCVLLSPSPAKYFSGPGQIVTVTWKVKNVGHNEWDLNSIDVAFRSGEKMAIGGNRFDIPSTVLPDQSIVIQVSMKAPDKLGEYHNTWSLVRGENHFCKFSVQLVVK